MLQHHQGTIKQIAQVFGVRPRKPTTKEEERLERYQAIREVHQKGHNMSEFRL